MIDQIYAVNVTVIYKMLIIVGEVLQPICHFLHVNLIINIHHFNNQNKVTKNYFYSIHNKIVQYCG